MRLGLISGLIATILFFIGVTFDIAFAQVMAFVIITAMASVSLDRLKLIKSDKK